MIYDDPVDKTYMVPKYNEDPEEDEEEDNEEEEAEDPGYDMWIRHVQGPARTLAVMSEPAMSTLEEEEKGTWAICPNCHGIGEEGGVCTNCEDMGMIYNIPMEDEGYNLQNHDDMDRGCSSSDATLSLENNKESQESEERHMTGAKLIKSEMRNRNWMNGC